MRSQFPIFDEEMLYPEYTTDGDDTGYFNVPCNTKGDIYWMTRFFVTKAFRVTATTNDLYVKILGARSRDSDNNLTWAYTAQAEQLVGVGTPFDVTITDPFLALKVQVKRATDDDGHNGTLSVYAWGTTLNMPIA